MLHYLANGTVLETAEWGSRVWLQDGTSICSAPHDTPEYRATARELGYGDDTLRMAQEHDILHALLADFLSIRESPALRVGAGIDPPSDLSSADENAVFAIARFANMCGVNILKARLMRKSGTL